MGKKEIVFTQKRKNAIARLIREAKRTAYQVGRLEALSLPVEVLAELPDIPSEYLAAIRAGKSPQEAVEAAGLYNKLRKLHAANALYCSDLPIHLRTTFERQFVFVSAVTEEAYLLDEDTDPYSWIQYDPVIHGPLYKVPTGNQEAPRPLCPECGEELEYMPVINARKATSECLHACINCGSIWRISASGDGQSIHRYPAAGGIGDPFD